MRIKRTLEVKKDILWRVYLSFLGITLLSLLVLGRAFYIQRFQGKYWRSMSDSLHQRFVPLTATRGTIYSEDGQMLSTSIPTFDVYMDLAADGLREKKGKRFRENLDSFCLAMSSYFGDRSAAQYKKEISLAYKNNDRYYQLRKKMSFEQYKVFREFPLVRLGKNKSGVIVDVNSKRLSPFGLLANRTIGLSREFVDGDGKTRKQNVGIERKYDSLLCGHDGQRLVRYIAGGTPITVDGTQTDPENGRDIYTTLDVNIQDITETALMRMMLQCEGPYGTAIVMETATGKIKALANLGRRPDGSYWEDDNYAVRTTEPGSTIKLATLLSVLESGSSSPDDMVEVGSTGRMRVAPVPRDVVDAERSPRPMLSVKECFAHSSNVGMSKLAYKAFGSDPEELKKYLHHFHLDQRSPIDLPNVPKPIITSFKKDAGGLMNMLWVSFGYGINISPLNTITLYNAVANNGKMVKPYLVSSIQRSGTVLKKFDTEVMEEQLCKPEVIAAARSAMEMVVTEGTAKKAFKDIPFTVAGKTGTAHVSDGKIKYGDGVYQATFIGYFPADKPQFTCIVVIRTKPHAASHYGGSVAAPVFREIATSLYARYVEQKDPSRLALVKDSSSYFYAGYAPDVKKVLKNMSMPYVDSGAQRSWTQVYAMAAAGKPVMKGLKVEADLMPNVRGMGLKDAVNLLENMGIKVAIKGRGKVVNQSVGPGTLLSKGITVILELS